MEPRLFDLNIETILEAWDNSHAVRELIANALDEAVLSGTEDIQIAKDADDVWRIQDFGRGLRHDHFTQNESQEKLAAAGRVIGKFGVGLKDALATLHRNGVHVEIESAHGVISLTQMAKHGFNEIITLHAAVHPPRDAQLRGTRILLRGLPDADMVRAKSYFLRFSGDTLLEETKLGAILAKAGDVARIYVAGQLVAEETAFAFSYNITALTEPMKKALNRERTNVGRAAYADRVKSMLLMTQSAEVASVLADQLILTERGEGSDEVKWKDVAVHACKILNASGRYLFVSSSELMSNPDAVDQARGDGLQIVTVTDVILETIRGAPDVSGAPIRDLSVYEREWNESFEFDWVTPAAMSAAERAVFERWEEVAALVGGVPSHVRGIKVSNTMRVDFAAGSDALGLWDPSSMSIVIRRDQLSSLADFAGTLLHEIAHAKSGYGDVSRDFENELTTFLGAAAAAALRRAPAAQPQAAPAPRRGLFWTR